MTPLTAFLGASCGQPVALLRPRPLPKASGFLGRVEDTDDEHSPLLTVIEPTRDGEAEVRVAFADCTRVKFHFTPTDKDRP